MNNNADLGFAGLRQKQADLDTQENLLKRLNSLKDELRRLFKNSLEDSISDWKESTDFYLKSKGMIKSDDKYELANILVFPNFFEDQRRSSKGSHSFNVRIRYKTNISSTGHTINTVDYSVNIPAVFGSHIDNYHVPDKLDEDIKKYSEIVKDYKEPVFTFDVTYRSDTSSSTPLKVESNLKTINETLDIIFGHFFEKFKP